jgi:hypothetical protein
MRVTGPVVVVVIASMLGCVTTKTAMPAYAVVAPSGCASRCTGASDEELGACQSECPSALRYDEKACNDLEHAATTTCTTVYARKTTVQAGGFVVAASVAVLAMIVLALVVTSQNPIE